MPSDKEKPSFREIIAEAIRENPEVFLAIIMVGLPMVLISVITVVSLVVTGADAPCGK